jgi:predicted HicB family RNase H-like nuclease
MHSAHRATLEAVFANPVLASIRWREIESLFRALGAHVEEGRGSRVRVELEERGSMATTMQYEDYVARVEYDEETNLFYGEVANLRDVITFQGRSVAELKRAFRDSIADYLEFCAKRGRKPERPMSGKFVVRVSPYVHARVAAAAVREGKSMNAWVAETIERAAS